MKNIKTILLFTILVFSTTLMGCDQLTGLFNKKSDPVIIDKIITDKEDPDFPKKLDGSEYPDGTQIEYKKVETDDYTTIDETITCTDGTEVVVHILKEMEITTTNQTTTFPESENPEAPKTETVIEKTGYQTGKGNVDDKTTTTELNDGTKITETYLTEGFTEKLATSKETINPDGSSIKESFSTENVDDNTNTKAPYAISKTYLEKDTNGNITQDVQKIIEAQSPDGEYNIVKNTTITKNYSEGTLTESIVETMQQIGENDGLFTKETKDASGKTICHEQEYLFFETSSYKYHHGVNNYDNTMPNSSVKVIFDLLTKKAKITAGGSFPNDTYNHSVFVTTMIEDITQMKFENDKITILLVGGHKEPKEEPEGSGNWTYPIVGGTELNDVYTIDNTLSLSFDSQF